MNGIVPVQHTLVENMGQKTVDINSQQSFGSNKVDGAEKIVTIAQIVYRWPYALGNLGQNADNLAVLGIQQVLDFIVSIENLGRFDKNRLSRS